MTEKQYFTEAEMAADLINILEDGFCDSYSELFNATFNSDYYIIGTYEAKVALEQYGTFEAIDEVKEYEMDNFGEMQTEIEPEKIANTLYYITAEQFMRDTFEFDCVLEEAAEDLETDVDQDTEATPEVNQHIINKLLSFTEEEE